MNQPMTPQERAAALLERMGLCGHPAASQFVGDIIEHDQQTRRAALLEAAQVAITYGERARDEDLSGGYTSELIAKALDRIAQEG